MDQPKILTGREAKGFIWLIAVLFCWIYLPWQPVITWWQKSEAEAQARSITTAEWTSRVSAIYQRAAANSQYTPLDYQRDMFALSKVEICPRNDYLQHPVLPHKADLGWVRNQLYHHVRKVYYSAHAAEGRAYAQGMARYDRSVTPQGLAEYHIQHQMNDELDAARAKVYPNWDSGPAFRRFWTFVGWMYLCFIPWAFAICLVKVLAVSKNAREAFATFQASLRDLALATSGSFVGYGFFDPSHTLVDRIARLGAYKQYQATGQSTDSWRVERQYIAEAEFQILGRADAILALWSLIWRPRGEKAGYKLLTTKWRQAVYLTLLSVVSVFTGQTAVAAEAKSASPIDAVNLVFIDNPRRSGGPFQSIFLFKGDTSIGIYGYRDWPDSSFEVSQYVWHKTEKASRLVAGPYLIAANGDGLIEGGLTGILTKKVGQWQVFNLWYVGGTGEGLAVYVPQFHATTAVSRTTRLGLGAAFFAYNGTESSLVMGPVIRQKVGKAELRVRLGRWFTGAQKREPHLRIDFGFPLN